MQGECNSKAGRRSLTRLDTAEPQLILCKGRMNIHAKFVVSYKILVVYLQSCDTQTQTRHSYTTMCA